MKTFVTSLVLGLLVLSSTAYAQPAGGAQHVLALRDPGQGEVLVVQELELVEPPDRVLDDILGRRK